MLGHLNETRPPRADPRQAQNLHFHNNPQRERRAEHKYMLQFLSVQVPRPNGDAKCPFAT